MIAEAARLHQAATWQFSTAGSKARQLLKLYEHLATLKKQANAAKAKSLWSSQAHPGFLSLKPEAFVLVPPFGGPSDLEAVHLRAKDLA